jgi:hypothetical protein
VTEPKVPPVLSELIDRLSQARTQLLLLAGLLGTVVLAILVVDLATGGDSEQPSALGSNIVGSPGTRVAVVPTLVSTETPPPEVTGTPTPSSEVEALARDAERLRELPLLQAALVEYRDRFDEYPSTSGGVQTLCRFQDLDSGCELKDVLENDEEGILEDPLGPETGYWYASDGKTYTIWMHREGPGNPGEPICPEVIPHLRDQGALFCVTVGAPP